MKNLFVLRTLFFLDLKLLRKIFVEFFVLTGIMLLVFFFSYVDYKLYMLLPLVIVYVLFVFLIMSCIIYLNNEREKGHIIKVYKTLPLKDYDIYLSYITTPFIVVLTNQTTIFKSSENIDFSKIKNNLFKVKKTNDIYSIIIKNNSFFIEERIKNQIGGTVKFEKLSLNELFVEIVNDKNENQSKELL